MTADNELVLFIKPNPDRDEVLTYLKELEKLALDGHVVKDVCKVAIAEIVRMRAGFRAALKYLPREIKADATAFHPPDLSWWTDDYKNDLADMRLAWNWLPAVEQSNG